jgi:hypothetical protein
LLSVGRNEYNDRRRIEDTTKSYWTSFGETIYHGRAVVAKGFAANWECIGEVTDGERDRTGDTVSDERR